MTVQEITEVIKTLSPNDLKYLRNLLDEHLPMEGEVEKRDAFHQSLMEQGLVKELKKPTKTIERRLIKAKGKPVSQTIIEERR